MTKSSCRMFHIEPESTWIRHLSTDFSWKYETRLQELDEKNILAYFAWNINNSEKQ
jgi:hypothetical protein